MDEENSTSDTVNLDELAANIKTSIAQLVDVSFSNDPLPVLLDLQDPVAKCGLDESDLNNLFDLIFDLKKAAVLNNTDKKFVIKSLLLPRPGSYPAMDIVYRILSNIGTPQSIYKDGSTAKLRLLPTAIQLQLLDWLVCSLHLFGPQVYTSLRRMLPILFKLITYEYSRPYIANIIFLTISSSSTSVETYLNRRNIGRINSWKPWHVQLVVDLFGRFPLDEYLKSLLILFKTLDPTIDFNKFGKDIAYDMNKLVLTSSRPFVYPNFDYLSRLKELKYINDISSHNSSATILQDNLDKYRNFSRAMNRNKRQKFNNNTVAIDIDTLDFHNSSNDTAITEVHSFEALVQSLDKIKHINIRSIFTSDWDQGYLAMAKRYYCILSNLTVNDSSEALKKLDFFIRLSILDDNINIKELSSFCDRLCQFLLLGADTIILPSVKDYVMFNYSAQPIGSDETNVEYYNLKERLKLLKFLPMVAEQEFQNSVLNPILALLSRATRHRLLKLRKECTSQFITELMFIFSKWYDQVKDLNTYKEQKFNYFAIINQSLPKLYAFLSDIYKTESDFSNFLLIQVLRFVRSIEEDDVNELFNDSSIMLPQILVHTLLFKSNPFLFSELCGFIAWTKRYSHRDLNNRSIQNSYIMDTLNFIWRDKAFHLEKSASSPSKAFQLNSDFVTAISSSHMFNSVSTGSLSKVGNLFVNPAWSYIVAQLVWGFEDGNDSITTRHQGPISKESIDQLNGDSDVRWLSVNYDELKLKILQELDALGFTGFCDLLFGSLKPLSGKRKHSIETIY
ncbi:predicted protein [Scheffersomyces stipitis CBS 6054]|uniref:Uncharacterized protein n=1 Tax=Scheffersomyces stipitis (strain ATCC 58785 / CBS 6054 / NBRC 10063 / NRRL Y-11545) TaxID=322104 RepID=A3LRG6_PICST|nr:predicted protein [Scheffersomyces stipitis CBS 6054]ABN65381.2 predicted protein [Scheffersomyces stipitis CBS 6054]